MSEVSDAKESRVPGRSRFESVLQVRPDDIDMNQHVHASTYMDYVLAARFDQMQRCYRMSMGEFIEAGFGWVVKRATLNYKRALVMGDWFLVRTWVEAFERRGVHVCFEIDRRDNGKRCCDGDFDYTMVDLKTGRAAVIPDWIAAKYAI